ncbi:MAG: paraquat-inducible protein A, partial [Desulfobulbaceae bacterium]|nr:paraquat-inducible protein A [Desulfobulbaceae bacterium]
KGISKTTALTSGIVVLYQQNMAGMGAVVLVTCLLAPLFSMLSLLYVLAPLRLGYRFPWAAQLFAWYLRLRPWSMMEVYMLGILISMVKLTKMALVIPGPSFYSFIGLIFVLAASSVSLDPHLVWSKLAKAHRVHQEWYPLFRFTHEKS